MTRSALKLVSVLCEDTESDCAEVVSSIEPPAAQAVCPFPSLEVLDSRIEAMSDALYDAYADYEQLWRACDTLAKIITEQTEDRDALAWRLSNHDFYVAPAHRDIKTAQAAIQQLSRAIEEAMKTRDSQAADREAWTAQYEELKQKKISLHSSCPGSAEEEIRGIVCDFIDAGRTIARLGSSISFLEAEISHNTIQVDRLKVKVSDLEEYLREDQASFSDRERRLREKEAELATSQSDLAERRAEEKAAKAKLDELVAQSRVLSACFGTALEAGGPPPALNEADLDMMSEFWSRQSAGRGRGCL
jgi:chromosome segregation ATPase